MRKEPQSQSGSHIGATIESADGKSDIASRRGRVQPKRVEDAHTWPSKESDFQSVPERSFRRSHRLEGRTNQRNGCSTCWPKWQRRLGDEVFTNVWRINDNLYSCSTKFVRRADARLH